MKSLKGYLIRAAPFAFLAGAVNAATLNITESMQPVLDLLDLMPLIINKLPSIVIALGIVLAIIAAFTAVAGIFYLLPKLIGRATGHMGGGKHGG
jgi:ABC-type proline/glycine betaine transport system permease subunit